MPAHLRPRSRRRLTAAAAGLAFAPAVLMTSPAAAAGSLRMLPSAEGCALTLHVDGLSDGVHSAVVTVTALSTGAGVPAGEMPVPLPGEQGLHLTLDGAAVPDHDPQVGVSVLVDGVVVGSATVALPGCATAPVDGLPVEAPAEDAPPRDAPRVDAPPVAAPPVDAPPVAAPSTSAEPGSDPVTTAATDSTDTTGGSAPTGTDDSVDPGAGGGTTTATDTADTGTGTATETPTTTPASTETPSGTDAGTATVTGTATEISPDTTDRTGIAPGPDVPPQAGPQASGPTDSEPQARPATTDTASTVAAAVDTRTTPPQTTPPRTTPPRTAAPQTTAGQAPQASRRTQAAPALLGHGRTRGLLALSSRGTPRTHAAGAARRSVPAPVLAPPEIPSPAGPGRRTAATSEVVELQAGTTSTARLDGPSSPLPELAPAAILLAVLVGGRFRRGRSVPGPPHRLALRQLPRQPFPGAQQHQPRSRDRTAP